MCGISGWIACSNADSRPERSTLEFMLEAIKHRGPDEKGLHVEGGVGLGMTRLSINDVEGGQQPYFNEDRTVVAVFNGEIYNFAPLREELEGKGHRFCSRTDGEVIVHLWEEYGERFVEHLNGMFAIALWDGKQLFLCRDRFGIKPLFYTEIGKVLYFASELKCLSRLPGFCKALDHGSLRTYLNMEYVPAPRTIYRESKKVSPAHSLSSFRDGSMKIRRYWSFPKFTGAGGGSLQEWGERLRFELRRSVKRRLLADVPLGVFLSGGLDSSAITAMMAELPGVVKSFSVAFSEPTFDESSYSRRVAKFLDTEHHEQVLTPESALNIIEPLYLSLDEPLADAAIIPTYLLSQFARKEVTVCLAGEGADELLGGYPTYLAHQLSYPFGFLPKGLLGLIKRLVNCLPTSRSYMSLDFKLKRFCSGLGLPDVERHLTWMGSLAPSESERYLLNPESPSFSWENPPGLGGVVERIQTLDFHTYLSDGLLVKLDRATMLTSLEGRVPFLDHEFVESMAVLPTPYKFRGMDVKRALKSAMKDSLPEEVLGRPKKGFGIPLADWLRGPLKFLLEEYLSPSYLERQGLFRVEPIQALVREHLEGRADQRKPLWTLLVFQRWWSAQCPTL